METDEFAGVYLGILKEARERNAIGGEFTGYDSHTPGENHEALECFDNPLAGQGVDSRRMEYSGTC